MKAEIDLEPLALCLPSDQRHQKRCSLNNFSRFENVILILILILQGLPNFISGVCFFSYRLTTPTRSVHWGIPWGVVEDSMLLVGILVHGLGNWDAIKNDQPLMLNGKVEIFLYLSFFFSNFLFFFFFLCIFTEY